MSYSNDPIYFDDSEINYFKTEKPLMSLNAINENKLRIPKLEWSYLDKGFINNDDLTVNLTGRYFAYSLGIGYTIDVQEPEFKDDGTFRDDSTVLVKYYPTRYESEFNGVKFGVKVSEFEVFQCDANMLSDLKDSLQEDFELLVGEK